LSDVKIGIKLAYGIGQVAVNIKDTLFHYYFLLYFSTVLGLSAALVSADL
jgi:Na+/melibiose symporter-like transporter